MFSVILRLMLIVSASIFIATISDDASAYECKVKATWTQSLITEIGAPFTQADIAKFELRYTGVNVAASGIKYPKANTRAYGLTIYKPGAYSFIMFVHLTNGQKSKSSTPILLACK